MPDIFADYQALQAPQQAETKTPDIFADYQALNQQPAQPQAAQSEQPGMFRGWVNDRKEDLQHVYSAAAGVNGVFERALGNVAGLAGLKETKDFYADQANKSDTVANRRPDAATVGKTIGSIAMAAPAAVALPVTGIAGAASAAGIGFAGGYLGSDIDTSTEQKLQNATIGTLLGAGGYSAVSAAGLVGKQLIKGGKALKEIYQGSKAFGGDKFSVNTPSDIAEQATQKTLQQFGGDFSRATPQAFFQHVDDLTKVASDQKNRLYAVRDALAEKEGVGILRNNLAQTVKTLEGEKALGATSDTAIALKEAKRLLGSDVGQNLKISYSRAQSMVSDIGGKANEAFQSGNNALGSKFLQIKDALESDIDAGGGSAIVKQAHQTAKDYFKNVYSPISAIPAKEILKEGFYEGKYLASAWKELNKQSTRDALYKASQESLGEDAQAMLASAHINALKEASTNIKGYIDPRAYQRNLDNLFKNNPAVLRPFREKIGSLIDTIELAQKAVAATKGGNVEPSLVGASGLTFGVMGNPAAAILATGTAYQIAKGVPKIEFFKAAGKALNNPATANLLGKTVQATDPALKQHLQGILVKRLLKQSPALFTPQVGQLRSDDRKSQ